MSDESDLEVHCVVFDPYGTSYRWTVRPNRWTVKQNPDAPDSGVVIHFTENSHDDRFTYMVIGKQGAAKLANAIGIVLEHMEKGNE